MKPNPFPPEVYLQTNGPTLLFRADVNSSNHSCRVPTLVRGCKWRGAFPLLGAGVGLAEAGVAAVR
jgi:hypothetical protein